MNRLALLTYFLLMGLVTSSQSFIGMSKTKVRKSLEDYIAKNNLKGQFEENEFTVKLSINAPADQTTDFIYHFDSGGKCRREVRVSCDSCIQKYTEAALAMKQLDWMKLNETQYISRFSKRLLLELDSKTITVRQVDWNRESYNAIIRRRRV